MNTTYSTRVGAGGRLARSIDVAGARRAARRARPRHQDAATAPLHCDIPVRANNDRANAEVWRAQAGYFATGASTIWPPGATYAAELVQLTLVAEEPSAIRSLRPPTEGPQRSSPSNSASSNHLHLECAHACDAPGTDRRICAQAPNSQPPLVKTATLLRKPAS